MAGALGTPRSEPLAAPEADAAAPAAAPPRPPRAVAVAVGVVSRGKVTKIFPYGAFLKVEGGREGLLHKSKCGPGPKGRSHIPNKGDVVFARVLEVKADGKLAFSTLDVDARTGKERDVGHPKGKKRKASFDAPPAAADDDDEYDAGADDDDDDDDEYDAAAAGGQVLSIGVDGLDDEPRVSVVKKPRKKLKYQAIDAPAADKASPTVRTIAWSKSRRDTKAAPQAAAPSPKKAKASALAAPPEPKEFGVKTFAEIMAEKKKKAAA